MCMKDQQRDYIDVQRVVDIALILQKRVTETIPEDQDTVESSLLLLLHEQRPGQPGQGP